MSGQTARSRKSALLQRLDGLPDDEQHAVLLDLVRSHIATVLGNSSPEAIDPDQAFQELGFDSLTAVEMRNRLKAATGLALSPTLIFDYPNSAALAGYMHKNSWARRTSPRQRPHRVRPRSSASWGPFRSSGSGRRECWTCCSRWPTKPRVTGRSRGNHGKGHRGHGPRRLVNAALLDDDDE